MRQSPDSQVYTSLRDLARLRYKARGFSYLPRQPIGSLLAGRKRSRLRGRGLDFDELRHYRPGDDIRTMDWRVTNRTGKPHVRVYREERDRPVFLVVDQRLSMFFGSQSRMKSVVAAEVAALTAWRVTSVGDRVGAIIFNDSKRHESRPARSSPRVMGRLGELTRMNQALSVDTQLGGGEHALNGALQLLERSIGHDYLVIVISDFHGWNDATLSSLRRLSQHNDVVCDLRHNGQVVGDVDGCSALFLDHLLEGLQHFDLGGHIEGCRGFVQDQKIRIPTQGHRSHQTLALTA